MENPESNGPRFSRDVGTVSLTPDELAFEADLLSRLERQSAESGRLEARVETLEREVAQDRDRRARLVDRVKRERAAAEQIHQRAERAEAGLVSAREEVERLEQALGASEERAHMIWAQLRHTDLQLEWATRRLWRKLLRRPPKG